jgi:perosamine synthetase
LLQTPNYCKFSPGDPLRIDFSQKLAIEGGTKAKQTPFPLRKRHGEPDKRYLNEAIDSDILFFHLGTKVRAFEKGFAEIYGKKHCVACSSGTAAVHIAVGALQLPPGSEVITSAITDMGSLTGILGIYIHNSLHSKWPQFRQ